MTATSTEFQVNDRVKVNDPGWHRHGDAGKVVEIKRHTIRVQMDSHPLDVIAGAPIYFETEEN